MGREGRLPVVLVPGWALPAAAWADVAADLAPGREVALLDLPGQGERRAEPPAADLDGLAARLLEAAPGRALWAGWSLGGLAALAAALAAPERVAGLALVAATPRFTAASGWPGVEPAVLEGFARALAADPAATLRRFLALQVRGAAGAAATLRRLQALLEAAGPPHPRALEAGLAVLAGADLRGRLGAVRAPAAVIGGGRDRLVPPQALRRTAAALPDAEAVLLPEAGHAPFLSHPGEVLAALRALLARVEGARAGAAAWRGA